MKVGTVGQGSIAWALLDSGSTNVVRPEHPGEGDMPTIMQNVELATGQMVQMSTTKKGTLLGPSGSQLLQKDVQCRTMWGVYGRYRGDASGEGNVACE